MIFTQNTGVKQGSYRIYASQGVCSGLSNLAKYLSMASETQKNSESNISVISEKYKSKCFTIPLTSHSSCLSLVLSQWAEFMKMGRDVPDSELDAVIDSLKANECCTLIYTSGTTGNPKGVMLSHDNVSIKNRLCSECSSCV